MRPERPIWERHILDERPGFVATALGGTDAVQRFSRNRVGRDFVVGDIHGMYRALARLLTGLAFDPAADRLFAVGDLVDRGPDSPAALTWLNECPWFHPVRGNHDQMLLDSEAEQQGIHGEEWSVWALNDNGWWESVPGPQRREFAERFARLPFAIEIECDSGIVALVHADVPEDRTWDAFCAALRAGSRADSYHAIWSRRRWEQLALAPAGGVVPPVEGTPVRVICGHTAVRAVMRHANLWNIDTGAGRAGVWPDARLSAVRIHPEPMALFQGPPITPDGIGEAGECHEDGHHAIRGEIRTGCAGSDTGAGRRTR